MTPTLPLVSSPPSGTALLSEMSGVVFICLIAVIVFVVFCCCGLLITLIFSHTLCKHEPKRNKRDDESSTGMKLTESERKNLEEFSTAIIHALTEFARHPDTSPTVKEYIRTLLPLFILSPSQTSHHPKPRKVGTDGRSESVEVVVADNRGHTNEPVYDEPTNPQTKNDNEELIERYVSRYPVARQEDVSELECQNNPSYETSTIEPSELTNLLQSKLPDTYEKFKELTDYLNSYTN